MGSSSSILSHDFRYFSPNSSVECLKDSTKYIRTVEYLGPVYLKLNVDGEGYCPVRNCVAKRHDSVLASYCDEGARREQQGTALLAIVWLDCT